MESPIKTVQIDTKKLWMSRKEATKYLGVSKDWLEKRESEGKLNISKVGNTIFYIKSQIDKLIVSCAVTGANNFRNEK